MPDPNIDSPASYMVSLVRHTTSVQPKRGVNELGIEDGGRRKRQTSDKQTGHAYLGDAAEDASPRRRPGIEVRKF